MLNVHPSLLPRGRGAAPVERAIMAGDSQTGVSIMRLTAGLDSGPVCMSAGEPIRPLDTYGTLSARLQALAGELLLRTLDLKAQGTPPPFVEQDEAAATYAEKIGPQDRLLDPHLGAAVLERRVRALDPHICARVQMADGTFLGVRRAALASDSGAASGDRGPDELGVTAVGERLLLRCPDGDLELLVVQPPGGRAMDAAAFLRGHRAALR
jgi:methionyl-tRNA formyltransferase